MDTMFGDLPVLERWTRCRNVRGGWRGLRENGEKVFVEAGYSAVQKETGRRVIVKPQQYVARIPADDRMIKIVDGNPVGVILLERKLQRRRHERGAMSWMLIHAHSFHQAACSLHQCVLSSKKLLVLPLPSAEEVLVDGLPSP